MCLNGGSSLAGGCSCQKGFYGTSHTTSVTEMTSHQYVHDVLLLLVKRDSPDSVTNWLIHIIALTDC